MNDSPRLGGVLEDVENVKNFGVQGLISGFRGCSSGEPGMSPGGSLTAASLFLRLEGKEDGAGLLPLFWGD